MKYNFGYKTDKNYKGIILQDKTWIIIDLKKNTLNIMLPKKKFLPLLMKQIKDKKRKHFGVTFTETELEAIMKGLEKMEK